MKDIIVDYETYYSKKDDISAGTSGLLNYVRDSYAYIVSIVGPGIKFIGTIEEAQAQFTDGFWEDPQHRFWAANANFDEMWTRKLWPDAKAMKPWHCVLDRGAVQQLPQSLAGIVRGLFGTKVDKSLRDWMNGKHWKDLDATQQQELKDYCLSDSVEEMRVLKALPDPSTIEQEAAAHTRMTNLRGVRVNSDRLETDKVALHEHQHAALLRIPWHQDDAPLSPLALARWATSRGIPVPASLAKDDEECAELIGLHPELAAVIGAMRQHRKANTLVKKIESLQARLTEDSILPLELMYCGARHTRRWSSRGVNVQNLDREPYWLTADGKPGTGSQVANYIWPREWLVPRPGKCFLILDFSQVEPRCLNWLVGNDDLLGLIRAGFGIYEAYARLVGLWTDSGSLKKGNPALYKSVKAQVLGLGYGMGAGRYQEQAAKDGIIITLDESKATVKDFRARNHLIVDLWGAFDADVKLACLAKDKTLEITMPTGDVLRQFGVRSYMRTTIDEETGEERRRSGYESFSTRADFGPQSKQPSLWGGTLVENVTQRMARDVMAEAVLRLENAGLPVLWHAHDEVILEIDIDNREEAKVEAMRLMSISPDWAPGLPLAVEGDFADTYTK